MPGNLVKFIKNDKSILYKTESNDLFIKKNFLLERKIENNYKNDYNFIQNKIITNEEFFINKEKIKKLEEEAKVTKNLLESCKSNYREIQKKNPESNHLKEINKIERQLKALNIKKKEEINAVKETAIKIRNKNKCIEKIVSLKKNRFLLNNLKNQKI